MLFLLQSLCTSPPTALLNAEQGVLSMGFLATESKDPSNLSAWTVLRMHCTNVSSDALTGLDSQDLEGKLELPRLAAVSIMLVLLMVLSLPKF